MFKNSHTIGSAQTMLYFNDGLHKKSVLYTGDIGSNWYFHSPFVEKTEYIKKANMVISEATYGLKDSPTDKDDRLKDREKLKRYILETMESGGSMLIPSFSFSRTQELLWEIYNIFKDEKFPYSVIIDSKLSVDLTTLYPKILDKEKRLKMEEALKWENLFLVSEHKTHEMLKKSNKPKVIISSSGFLVEKTRSHSHLLELLPNKNGRICFVGYTGDENSLGHKLKNNKSITYKGEKYTIKSDIVNLSSFSSHIQYKELLWYLSEINSEKVIIHHSDKSAKESFVKDLQEEINKKNKTSKVLISNKDSKISI
jgi:metallo-beta-lactamase family protein